MDAVAEVVDSFPVSSREAEGTTQHKAYLAQLFTLFDALWGAADKAYDFIAVLEVCISKALTACDTSTRPMSRTSSKLDYLQSICCTCVIQFHHD